jgi:ribonuclease-3 family protein
VEENMSESSKYAPLTLAYIGDSVHTLFVRERVIGQSDKKVHELHILTSRYVKASAQAKAIHILLPELNEEEEAIYKRGRNAKSATVPKNAIVSDYRAATGFEALIGALYIDKKKERLNEILARSMEIINTED